MIRAALGLLLLAGCSAGQASLPGRVADESSISEDAHEALMDEIEANAELPKGARPLAQYERDYAPDEPGKVRGIFYLTRADLGARHWHDDAKQLPMIFDGGCDVLELEYDLKTKRSHVFCHGSA